MTPKPVQTVTDPAIAYAEMLWERLASSLFAAQDSIIAIIQAKAWEPLGYESFSKAWIDRIMSNITIASELRPHVVYQMFNEGLTPEQVAAAVKGITPDTAERLEEQRNNGVPADMASITVRRHQRKRPGPHAYIHLKVDAEALQIWRHVAESNGRTVTDIAIEAVSDAFDKLA